MAPSTSAGLESSVIWFNCNIEWYTKEASRKKGKISNAQVTLQTYKRPMKISINASI